MRAGHRFNRNPRHNYGLETLSGFHPDRSRLVKQLQAPIERAVFSLKEPQPIQYKLIKQIKKRPDYRSRLVNKIS